MSAVSTTPKPANSAADIDWDDMGFGLTETAFMFTASCDIDGEWEAGDVVPYGDLSLSPAAAVLNYGGDTLGPRSTHVPHIDRG